MSHTHRPDNAGFLKFVLLAGLSMICTLAPNRAQLSDPPPNNMKRGMYVDDADYYVWLYRQYLDTQDPAYLSDVWALSDFIYSRRMDYIALYNLEAGTGYFQNTVLNSLQAMHALSEMIGFLKAQHTELEVGIVISLKDFSKFHEALWNIYYYNFGKFLKPVKLFSKKCLEGISEPVDPTENRMLSSDHPKPEDLANNEFELLLALGAMNKVLFYNFGFGGEGTEYSLPRGWLTEELGYLDEYPEVAQYFQGQGSAPTPGPGPGSPITIPPLGPLFFGFPNKLDWINIEWEYWGLSAIIPKIYGGYGYSYNISAWKHYVALLQHGSYLRCLGRGKPKLESYIVLDPNMDGIFSYFQCPSFYSPVVIPSYNVNQQSFGPNTCPPDGFIQASFFDSYLDRIFSCQLFSRF
ncbi:MAG: hypothetical protein N2050_10595 [Flavobacteriales bacterium]|nr:hypothetical protein [Flavobacteriales bacterium]